MVDRLVTELSQAPGSQPKVAGLSLRWLGPHNLILLMIAIGTN